MKICTIQGCTKPHRARGLCSTHYNATHQPERHRTVLVPCTVCGRDTKRRPTTRMRPVCSSACRTALRGYTPSDDYDWARMAATRARAAGATVIELFDRAEIFERDNWTCHVCNNPVDRAAPPLDPASPTVDHVIALVNGGEHSRANAACAHLACNSRKGADLALTTATR